MEAVRLRGGRGAAGAGGNEHNNEHNNHINHNFHNNHNKHNTKKKLQKPQQPPQLNKHNNHNNKAPDSSVPFLLWCPFKSNPRLAAKAAPSTLVVATRAADGGCGAGYGDPPFALQGGHRAQRPTGTEDSHQHQGGSGARAVRRPTRTEDWHQHRRGTCRVL